MNPRNLEWLAGLAAAVLVPLASGDALAQDGPAIEEIVVTASKREERLLDVPSAVSTLGSEKLETLGVESFQDYMGLVPNVSQRSFGAPGAGTVIIRGLNSGPQQLTNTVGFYLDETPLTASGSLSVGSFVTVDPALADVARIEVLKGPQGTLYGASSLGGLIRIISKRPDLDTYGANVEVSGSTIDNASSGYGLRGTVNAPIREGRIGLRLSGFHRLEPGFASNVETGSVDVNEATISGARLSLLARLGDDVELLVNGLFQNTEADGFAGQDNVTDSLEPLYGPYLHSSYFDPRYEAEYRTLSATLDWTVGPGTLTSTLAYGEYETYLGSDYTDVYGPLLAPLMPPGFGLRGDPAPSSEKLTAEIRYASERIGRFELLGGLFYTDESNLYPIAIHGEVAATGAPLPAPFDNVLSTRMESSYEEYAVFGDATFYFTDRIDVTLGARYSENDQQASSTRSGLLLGLVGAEATSDFAFDDSAATYLATLRWRPSDNLSTFLRAASGYRPGGPQTNSAFPDAAPFEADTVWNYEAGIKTTLLDSRLRMAASIYHIDWEDMQLNTLVDGFVFVGNAGKSEIDGMEVELQANPIDDLSLSLSLGYNDAEITEIDPAASASLGAVEGDALPLSPNWSGAATADYQVSLSSDLTGSLGATIKYTGERPSSYSAAALNPNVDLPSYTTLDLRAGLVFGRYRVQLRVENATNEDGITTFSTGKLFPGQILPSSATLIRPRSYVLSFAADFGS